MRQRNGRLFAFVGMLSLASARLALGAASEPMRLCAYDGSSMKESAMEAKVEMKGKTLYFCSKAEHDRFMKNPAAYLRILEGKKYRVQLNFISPKEYDASMEAMKMAQMMKMALAEMPIEPSTTHYLIVTVMNAKTGEKIADLKKEGVKLALEKPGAKAKNVPAMIEPMMKYAITGVDLSAVGTYRGKLAVNVGGLGKETLTFSYDVKATPKAASKAPASAASQPSGSSHQH
jgi:YHS domain-containing protein